MASDDSEVMGDVFAQLRDDQGNDQIIDLRSATEGESSRASPISRQSRRTTRSVTSTAHRDSTQGEPLFLSDESGSERQEMLFSQAGSPPRRFDRKGKSKARTVSSDPLALDSTSPPEYCNRFPSSPRRRYRPIVELPLQPLSTLRRYHYPNAIRPPSQSSRQRLLGHGEPSAGASSSRSSSIVPIGLKRPKRSTTNKIPTRRTTSPGDDKHLSDSSVQALSVSDDEDDGNQSEESRGEFEASEDELLLRRSKRVGVRSNDGTMVKHQRNLRSRGTISTFSSSRSTLSSTGTPPPQNNKRKRGRPSRDTMRPPPRTTRKRNSEDEDSDFGINIASESEEDELMTDEEHKKGKTRSEDNAEDILSRHRKFCEKCQGDPAITMLANALKRKKRPGKKKKRDDDEITDTDMAEQLQGWLECSKCVLSSHWGCLGENQRKSVLLNLLNEEGPPRAGQKPRRAVGIDESTTFVCAKCTAAPVCFVCHKVKLEDDMTEYPNGNDDPNHKTAKKQEEADGDEKMSEKSDHEEIPLKFRCYRCKQCCHYEHLKDPFDEHRRHDLDDIAEFYQNASKGGDAWFCHQCRDWVWTVDNICAWRPSPPGAIEPKRAEGEKPYFKDDLPREYLVKWTGRGFRHVTWVPHTWLQILSSQKLRIFLERGPALDLITDETLAAKGDEMDQPTIARILDEDDKVQAKRPHGGLKSEWEGHGPAPDVNAEASIPIEWSTVDRVLDVMLLPPKKLAKRPSIPPPKRGNRILSASASPSPPPKSRPTRQMRPDGQEPPWEQRIEIGEWEKKAGRILTEGDTDEVADMVTWCFVKWDDLQYDQSCWDTPPPVDSALYPAFKYALRRYLRARQTVIPVLTSSQCRERDAEASRLHVPPDSQPDCVVGGKLMPFQMEGFQWLLYKHFKRESCILADDMGLGKTIQIASLLGYLGSSKLDIYPCLVIVPNSTITNWAREFEKWVPHMRVVPFYGEAASRQIISKYELYHKGLQNKAAGLKAHVVLTTYDMITSKDFRVFSSIPRWEVLCVDEGQRLKSDSNLIFNRLKTLNSVHRILLTGTPLNNNLRELFNLLNFLDPDTFSELEDLEARFNKLNEGLVQELHTMIKPYILRRIKADVLKLPPKVEIIVPISLAPLQKNLYKGILERNADVLKAIAEARRKRAKAVPRALANGTVPK